MQTNYNILKFLCVFNPTLEGPNPCQRNSIVIYTITNFSSFKTYSYNVDQGSITRIDDELHITPPSSGNSIILTISDGTYTSIYTIQIV